MYYLIEFSVNICDYKNELVFFFDVIKNNLQSKMVKKKESNVK